MREYDVGGVSDASGGSRIEDESSIIRVQLAPRAVGRLLTLIIGVLTFAHLAILWSRYYAGHDRLLGLAALFNLDREGNIPTYFSGLQLLFAGLFVASIALTLQRRRERGYRTWWVLAAVLTFMSIDEVSQIHENFYMLVEKFPALTAVMGGRAWVFVGLLIVAVVGAYFIPFLFRLPTKTRWGYIAAGGLFVIGAAGLEVVEALVRRSQGRGLAVALTATAQEVLEMASIAYFIVVTLRHARSIGVWLDVRAG